MTDELVVRITEIAERVATPEGLEVVEVEIKGAGKARLVRIYIDKPEGASLSNCEHVSHQVGTILDAEDVIPGDSYTLEVSTPGVERKLIKPRDFERFLGKKIKVVLKEPVEGKALWDGTLIGFSNDEVTLEPAPGQAVRFHLQQLKKANLKFEW